MLLTINQVNALLNVILPMTLDGQRAIPDPQGGPTRMLPGDTYFFALRLKQRDIMNRKNLNLAWQAFDEERKKISKKHFGDAEMSEKHDNFPKWKEEVEALANEKVQVKLWKLKVSDFQLDRNEQYPTGNFNLLDGFGLVDFDVDGENLQDADEAKADEAPAKPKAVPAAA